MPSTSRSSVVDSTLPVLRVEGLGKSYAATGPDRPGLRLFHDLALEIKAGEMIAVVGRSGSGKSSLLHLLAGLDRPSAGKVWLGSAAVHELAGDQATALRNKSIGYVWQFHYLLPEFSAQENVAMPLLAGGRRRQEALAVAGEWLRRVGLAERREHRAGELSGGEQQRVAIARALVTGPTLVLADEPTGDLDDETAAELFGLLRTVCREQRTAMLLVTHSTEIAAQCDRVLRLSEGTLQPLSLQPVAPDAGR